MSAYQPACANSACESSGRYACKKCRLVSYCGPDCQKSHWQTHKLDCNSRLGKEGWQPGWILENRQPAFMGDGPPMVAHGGAKYLWGNMPAIDILQLAHNEGSDYSEPLCLLFAASGDLRNVVKTIADIPDTYNQPIETTLNDRDLSVVARNTIILLIALEVDDPDIAADCIIHVWYSALLRQSDLDILQNRIRPMVESICDKIAQKPANSLQAKTWAFGSRSLRLVMTKSAWEALLGFFDTPGGLTRAEADRIRRKVTLAEGRADYRDRHLLFQHPSHRVPLTRFREDGLLLPFGARRDGFVHPNPTFYQEARWPMFDNSEPLEGWSAKEVHEAPVGPADADIYGKLFATLRKVLRSFLHRLSKSPASFELYQMDASALPKHLDTNYFTRIETSNITDRGYLGTYDVLRLLVPSLQNPSTNAHATLISSYLNAVAEESFLGSGVNMVESSDSTQRAIQYLGPAGSPTFIYRLMASIDFVTSYDQVFDGYARQLGFSQMGPAVGATMKDVNTVIEKWPFKLKLKPGQAGAQEEFDLLLRSGVSTKTVYLEWKKV